LRSLKRKTAYQNYDLVIVDNGTTNERALDILNRVSSEKRCRVLRRPGPFNFSSLSNEGAAAAAGDLLVFLNNDIVAIDPEWLHMLVHWLQQPRVGVVGAKLLFPDRSVEHAGMVVGQGGYAGHIFHREPADEPGYLGQLSHARRVSAVTGACLGISRFVFNLVGGFDAANFPVDLNDVDLCLRADAAGYRCIWTPDVVLYHFQSATRGVPFRPSKVYQRERECFRERWFNVIRDDPHFHPALSIYSRKLALA
jgi:GT2 family glycosyltransferase